MKVRISDEIDYTKIETLRIGDVFMARRTTRYGKTDEKGFYMKVDPSSGLTASVGDRFNIAVNLETGQLRKFSAEADVEALKAEVVVK